VTADADVDRQLVAYHESGHAAAAHHVGYRLERVSINVTDDGRPGGGHVLHGGPTASQCPRCGYLDRLVVAQAGIIAEGIAIGAGFVKPPPSEYVTPKLCEISTERILDYAARGAVAEIEEHWNSLESTDPRSDYRRVDNITYVAVAGSPPLQKALLDYARCLAVSTVVACWPTVVRLVDALLNGDGFLTGDELAAALGGADEKVHHERKD
jgi:hypothetical protein